MPTEICLPLKQGFNAPQHCQTCKSAAAIEESQDV